MEKSCYNLRLSFYSLRCQSLLHLKLYKIQKKEWQECQKIIGEQIHKASTSSQGNSPSAGASANGGGGGANGISPTPSPAGSEGDASVCSKSSGYTSAGELSGGGGLGNYSGGGGVPTPPNNGFAGLVGGAGCGAGANGGFISFSVDSRVMKTHYQLGSHVSQSHECWEEADMRIKRRGGGCQGERFCLYSSASVMYSSYLALE